MSKDNRPSALKNKYASYLGQTDNDYVNLEPKMVLMFQGTPINERELHLIKSYANDLFVRDGVPLYIAVIKAMDAHLNGKGE